MAIITPVGKMDFDWSPQKNTKNVRTASSDKVASEVVTDKDLLYMAAKKVIEAQFDESNDKDKEVEGEKEDGVTDDAITDDVVEVDIDDTNAKTDDEVTVELDDVADAGEESAIIDVQEAVAELVDKSEAADAVVDAVTVALDKVNDAVEEVRSAVGAAGANVVEKGNQDVASDDEVFEIEIEDDCIDESGDGEVNTTFVSDEQPCCDENSEEIGGEDIIQESDKDAYASIKKSLKKEAGSDDFVKTSKISPLTRKKIMKFWKDDLGYAPDYVKLMTTDYEK